MQGDFYSLTPATRKLCSDAVHKDERSKELLTTYYNSLSEAEKEHFGKYSEQFWSFAKRGAKKYKISKNAILIAMRLKDELDISCYPFVEKIATKGWDTRGGTFSWSMRVLDGSVLEHELCSFEPASMFISKKYSISVGPYNGFTVVSADTKSKGG